MKVRDQPLPSNKREPKFRRHRCHPHLHRTYALDRPAPSLFITAAGHTISARRSVYHEPQRRIRRLAKEPTYDSLLSPDAIELGGEGQQLDVLEPAIGPVVLQADIARARMIFVGDVELVRCAVWPLVRLGPLVQVHVVDFFAIELHVYQILVAGDLQVIPLTNGIHCVPCRLDKVVNRARIVEACSLAVKDLHFDAIETHILARPNRERVGPNKDTAIAVLADLEIKSQTKVCPLPLVDHHVVAAAVWIDAVLLDRPLTRLQAACRPARKRFAIEEEEPSLLLFLGSQLVVVCKQRPVGKRQPDNKKHAHVLHLRSPAFLSSRSTTLEIRGPTAVVGPIPAEAKEMLWIPGYLRRPKKLPIINAE
jgi:hypothetical protein